jgi:hypothetical protein
VIQVDLGNDEVKSVISELWGKEEFKRLTTYFQTDDGEFRIQENFTDEQGNLVTEEQAERTFPGIAEMPPPTDLSD